MKQLKFRAPCAQLNSQRGATLLVGMIMLVLITLLVTSAFSLSTSNLKSVGNMQLRNEAIAAANLAIEQVISSSFTNAPAAETVSVDINNDGTNDFNVTIATPTCVRASIASGAVSSSASFNSLAVTGGNGTSQMSVSGYYNTLWDIDATVIDAVSGANVHVRSGTRVKLTESQKNSVCI